ncbi:cytochrome c biogenesis protein CcsA [Pyrobaculum ferrireducens]|nr:cytochrome c biogenesis protein CcsA [Pyrobaculum ferrireducens]
MHFTGAVFITSLLMYLAYLTSLIKAPRWSRWLLIAATAALTASWALYTYSFLAQDFSLAEVARNTNLGMPWWLRLAASWASTGSSLLLFTFFIGLYILAAHLASAPRVGLSAATAVLLVVGASVFLYGTFDTLSEATIGGGLNPLLKSFWVAVHPPLVFLGYAGVLVTSLSLAAAESQKLKRLMYVALASLFAGLVVGGYWSYVTFGWGGYWAWDPVETAQLMVFVAATASLHVPSSLGQLRRASYLLAASGVFLALFVTRTGMSPLHGFASPGAGGYLLLAAALLFLFAFIRDVLTAKFTHWASWGRTVTFLVIFAAGLLLYGSLLVPAIGVAAGVNTSPPQMDDGMWFYNPALYVLVFTTLVLAPLIYLERGGRLLVIYLAAGLAASGLAVALVLAGVLVISLKSHVLTNVAVAAALAWSVPAGVVIAYSAFKAGGRSAALTRVLHLALLIFFVAVVYSLPFAYNRAYFLDVYITPEATAKVAGFEVSVVNYSLGLMEERLDIYTVYRGNAVYSYAQAGLASVTGLLSQIKPMIDEAARRVERSPVLGFLFRGVETPLSIGDVVITLVNSTKVVLRNASLAPYVAHTGGGFALMLSIHGESNISIVNQTVLEVEPTLLRVENVEINISGVVVAQGGGGYVVLIPMSAQISAPGAAAKLPMLLDMNLTLYYMAFRPGTPIYGLLYLPFYNLLSDARFGRVFSQDFPKAVSSGAYSKATLSIDGRRVDAVVRYEVSGEVSGVHGLVSTVVTIPRGLGDVYIVVFTPYVKGSLSYYPEPMIYYIHNILRSMPPVDALRVAAVLITGFFLDQLGRASPETFPTLYTNAYLEVLTLAYKYDPRQSPIYTEGLHITVKEVPAVNLLWASSIAAAALLIILAFVRR